MGKRATQLWEYYQKEDYDGSTPKLDSRDAIATCQTCHARLKMPHGSTTSLRTHLKSAHNHIYTELMIKEAQDEEIRIREKQEMLGGVNQVDLSRVLSTPSTSQAKRRKPNPNTPRNYQIRKWPSQSRTQLEWDAVVATYMALSNLPLSHLESPAWKLLSEFAQPKARNKSPETFSRFKIPLVFNNLLETLKRHLQSEIPFCDAISFTTDGWKSKNGNPFLSLTLHYIDSDFELHRVVLECKNLLGRDNEDLLAHSIDEIVNDFEEIISVPLKVLVTDGSPSMSSAVKHCQSFGNHYFCVNYVMNSCLQKALSQTEDIQLLEPLVSLCNEYKEIWSNETYPVIHRIQIDLYNLEKKCKDLAKGLEKTSPNLGSCISTFTKAMNESITLTDESFHHFITGAFMHPHYRGKSLKLIGCYEKMLKMIVDNHQTTIFYRSRELEDQKMREANEESRDHLDPLDKDLMDLPTEGFAVGSQMKPPLELEFERFFATERPHKEVDVLRWWKDHQGSLPLLAKMAREVLCIPVTSGSTEKMFAAEQASSSDPRYNLDPELTPKLFFIQKNYGKVNSDLTNWEFDCPGESFELAMSSHYYDDIGEATMMGQEEELLEVDSESWITQYNEDSMDHSRSDGQNDYQPMSVKIEPSDSVEDLEANSFDSSKNSSPKEA